MLFRSVDVKLNALYQGKVPSYNIVNDFRIACCQDQFMDSLVFKRETKNLFEDIIQSMELLRKTNPKISVIDFVDAYLMKAQLYAELIQIHQIEIKNGRGLAKDYVQMGNALLNLGNKIKAVKSFNKAIEILRKMNTDTSNAEAENLVVFVSKIEP